MISFISELTTKRKTTAIIKSLQKATIGNKETEERQKTKNWPAIPFAVARVHDARSSIDSRQCAACSQFMPNTPLINGTLSASVHCTLSSVAHHETHTAHCELDSHADTCL